MHPSQVSKIKIEEENSLSFRPARFAAGKNLLTARQRIGGIS